MMRGDFGTESSAGARARLAPNGSRLVAWLAIACACAGCSRESSTGAGGAGAASSCAAEVAWGRRLEGAFAAYADGDEAEITLGFQGFRFIESALRVTGMNAPSARVRFRVEVEGQSTITQDAGQVRLLQGPDDALYADSVLLFFNDMPLSTLVGRSCETSVLVEAAGCTGTTGARVELVAGSCQPPPDGGIDDAGHYVDDAGNVYDGGSACDAAP